jgi:hypothetical protein
LFCSFTFFVHEWLNTKHNVCSFFKKVSIICERSLLSAAPRGNGLNLTFSHFELEQHHPRYTNCSYDYLAISTADGTGGVLTNTSATSGGIRYCGNNLPTVFSTSASLVRLEFVSDNSVAQNGFRLEWVVTGCGGRSTKPSATFRDGRDLASCLELVDKRKKAVNWNLIINICFFWFKGILSRDECFFEGL